LVTRDYGIDGVPSVIVNGKYRTTATMAGIQGAILEVVNFLIAKERAK
jgi:thiol:disulfide interchange protein DsbA